MIKDRVHGIIYSLYVTYFSLVRFISLTPLLSTPYIEFIKGVQEPKTLDI